MFAKKSGVKPYRVLCIDDEKNILKAFGLVLRDERLAIKLISGGEEGVRAFKDDPPDLVILDVAMPGMNGYEVLAAMRLHKYVPTIMISGHASLRDVTRRTGEPPDAYIQKPTTRKELMDAVWYLLGESD